MMILSSADATSSLPVLPILALLLIAVAVAIASQQLRLPFNIALVVAGMVLSRFHWGAVFGDNWQGFQLQPEIILDVLLPVLLFQAALETSLSEFRANLVTITLLALLGTFGAVAIIGLTLACTVFPAFDRSILLGLLAGAILSTTDTISVLTVFKTVRVPRRLAAIIEGESLFNDGAALVSFAILVEVLATPGGDMALGWVLLTTVQVVLGGLLVGAAVGFFAGHIAREIPDSLTCLMLTTVVAYGSYIAGVKTGVSGVIATVTAGLVFRFIVWTGQLSPGSRLAMLSFWEFAGFLVNSVVFLLLGFQIELQQILNHADAIGYGLVAIHGARMLTVYPLFASMRHVLGSAPVPLRWQHVMVAGNIKGAVSAVMALSVSETLIGHPARELILSITLGLVLVTLLTQGLSLGQLLCWMGVGDVGELERELQIHQMRLLAARSALRELDRLHEAGLITNLNYRHLRSRYQLGVAKAESGLQQLQSRQELQEAARRMITLQRHLLTVEKTAILEAVRDKIVSEDVAAPLLTRIDEELLLKGRHLDEE